MKKSVLLLATLVMGVASAYAQWTKPVPQFVPMADDGETEQYLYNVEAGAFFRADTQDGDGHWLTRASVNYKEGAKVKMAKVYEDESQQVWLKTWSIFSYVPKASIQEFRKAFADNPKSIWTDTDYAKGTGAHADDWIVTAVGDKYEITNPLAGMGKLGKADISGKADDRLYLLDATDEENWIDEEGNCMFANPCTTWAFVSVAEYDLIIPRIAAYNAAMSLKAVLDSEDAKLVKDKSAYEAVYNNLESTADELETAEADLRQAILDAKSEIATPDNPIDMTNAIVNPNFDGQKYDGWAGSSWGAGGNTDECAERYDMTFDTYQDISGLAKGVYKLLVNGFFRGDVNNTPILYATVSDVTYSTPFYLRNEHGAPYQLTGVPDQEQVGDMWTPNSMKAFVAYENEGYYNDMFVYIPMDDSGKLRIGAKKDKNTGTDWVICDTWRLIYYGNSLEAYKFWYNDVKRTVLEKIEKLVTEETLYDRNQAAALEAALAAGEAATTEAELREAAANLNAVADATVSSITAYAKYQSKLEEIREYMGEHSDIEGPDVDFLVDYINEGDPIEPDPEYYPNGNAQYILDNCVLNTAQITAETEYLQNLFSVAIKNGMKEGTDVSHMLVNPNFDGNFDGWNYKEGKIGNHNVECYDQVVDVWQEVNDIPNGLYALSCQAFERPGGNGSFNGTEAPSVFLFMNNFQTPVQNICADAVKPADAIDKQNCYLENGVASGNWPYDYDVEKIGYVPNSIDGAYYAFNLGGRYVQTVYGLVTDGKMKIGLTSNGNKIHWVLWANFKLTYMGKNAQALASVITDLSATLEAYLEEHFDEMSEPAATAATAAIEAGEQASDPNEMWEAVVEINEAITASKANVAAVNDFITSKEAMGEAAELYGETASQEALDAYAELIDVEYDELETEEIEAYTIRFKEVAGQLRIPAYKDASDATPVDFTQIIVNASFDEDASGWSGDVAAHNSQMGDAEFYNKNYNMYQEFYGLPEGTYELKVQGFYRQGNAEPDYKAFKGETEAAFNGKLFANNDSVGLVQTSSYSIESKEAVTDYAKCGAGVDGDVYIPNTMTSGGLAFEEGHYWNSLIFKYDGNGVLRIGIAKNAQISGDWTLFDNFQLIYYGPKSEKEPTKIKILPNFGGNPTPKTVKAIYDPSGMQIEEVQEGLNILLMEDYTTEKVYVE